MKIFPLRLWFIDSLTENYHTAWSCNCQSSDMLNNLYIKLTTKLKLHSLRGVMTTYLWSVGQWKKYVLITFQNYTDKIVENWHDILLQPFIT